MYTLRPRKLSAVSEITGPNFVFDFGISQNILQLAIDYNVSPNTNDIEDFFLNYFKNFVGKIPIFAHNDKNIIINIIYLPELQQVLDALIPDN